MSQDLTKVIDQFRSLRGSGRRLRNTLVEDLRSFQKQDRSFFTLPTSDQRGMSIATSCTALMALVGSNKLGDLFPETSKEAEISSPAPDPKPSPPSPSQLFQSLVKETWASSGLRDLNAFTSAMVIRAAGFLVSHGELEADQALKMIHQRPIDKSEKPKPGAIELALEENYEPTLGQIIEAVGKKAPDSFAIPGYPAKTAMAYWFVDGVTKAGFNLVKDSWERIAKWADDEFDRQFTYVVSDNTSLMDPAALAMAACLVARIKQTCSNNKDLSEIAGTLATSVELRHAIHQVYKKQSESGIWNRYFPLFHFPGSGAADYCFSFEFLEAMLIEFSGTDVLGDEQILGAMQESMTRTLSWCSRNRLMARNGDTVYHGWNAGGEVRNLAAGLPEAWATATVHMFLFELESTVSDWLQKLILERFGGGESTAAKKWDRMIDVDLTFPIGVEETLKGTIEREFISKGDGKNQRELRRTPMDHRRSALLFGPPGTSKTTIARGIAGKLSWPLLIITPSSFLSGGLEQIYARANDLFLDLMDLSAVVVLFDEMDALAQTRGNPTLDVTRQLLTTSMLPKLADLHDLGRVIFLMATNHRKDLDPAITRPGRFDLLLCVGPPKWERKLDHLEIATDGLQIGEPASAKAILKRFSSDPRVVSDLDRFTVADLRSFVEYLRGDKETLLVALNGMNSDRFASDVHAWAQDFITLKAGRAQPGTEETLFSEFNIDKEASRIQ